MTTLTIQIPDAKAAEIKSYLKAQGATIAIKAKTVKKSSVLKDIETGLKQVKLIREGKMKGGTIAELLNGK